MENNNAGLKFHILSDGEIFVDNDKNTKVDCFSELTIEGRMLHNFEQMERFCRLGKGNFIDKDENYFIKYYIVLKYFSDVVTPGEVTEDYFFLQAGKSDAISESDKYRAFKNGKDDKSKGFVFIDVINPLYNPSLEYIYQNAVCYVSVIDNKGNERFTQTTLFLPPEVILREPFASEPFAKFISRETVLCNATELLHYDDLVLSVKLEFHKHSDVEIEKKILSFFENLVPYNTEVGEETNDLFEECLHFDEDFFFNSDIGKILCNNSFFFKSRLNYSQFETERRSVVIPYSEREHLINICRILIGDYIIVKATSEEICELYRIADQYGISRVVEFCRCMLKQHVCLDNFSFIEKIADTYNDTELKTAVASFQNESEKFICYIYSVRCQGVPEDCVVPHLHDAKGKYLECDNIIQRVQEYCSVNSNYKVIDHKFNFPSIFNINKIGEVTVSLESNFMKIMCKNSDSLKRQIEHSSSETENQTIQIDKKYIKPFKNIYRLLMGGNYIKAITIYDIICLYELSKSYRISLIMEICRNLFQRYICSRNVETIRNLTEICPDDIELKEIVETFDTESERYGLMQIERRFKKGRYSESNNFEILNEEYDFYN